MCDFETVTGNRIHVVTVQLVAWSEANGVNKTVEFRPRFCQLGKHRIDAFVFCYVTSQNQIRTQLSGEFFYARFQFVVLVGESQLGAFTVHSLCDTVGNGEFAGYASDQNALTG